MMPRPGKKLKSPVTLRQLNSLLLRTKKRMIPLRVTSKDLLGSALTTMLRKVITSGQENPLLQQISSPTRLELANMDITFLATPIKLLKNVP